MSLVKKVLIAGLEFGIIDVIPMLFMNLLSRNLAVAGAFVNRLAIGFLIPNTTLKPSRLVNRISCWFTLKPS